MILTKPRPETRRIHSTDQAVDWPALPGQRMAMTILADEAEKDLLPPFKVPLRIASVIFSLAVWWAAIEGGLKLWSLVGS